MLVELRVEPGPLSSRGRSDPQPSEPLIAHPQPLPARPSLTPVPAQTRRSRPRHTDYEKAVAAGPPPSLTDFYPASLDPKFFTDLSTLGYLTTLPGRRAHAFIGAGTIEPGMNAVEETTMKDTLSPVELVSLILDTSNFSGLLSFPGVA